MLSWVHRFVTDEAFFIATLRGLLAMLGAMIASGILPTTGVWWKVGLCIMAASHFIPAGQANQSAAQIDAVLTKRIETEVAAEKRTAP